MSLWLICSHCGSLPPLTIMFCNNFDKWNSRAEINISGIAYVLEVILMDGCFS